MEHTRLPPQLPNEAGATNAANVMDKMSKIAYLLGPESKLEVVVDKHEPHRDTQPLLAAAPAASDAPGEVTEWTSYLKDLGERRLKEEFGAVKTRLDEWGVLKAASTAMSLVSAVLLYSDLATDGVFMVSLFLTGNYIWGSLSAFFITLQFAASFAGVLLYVSRVADAKATAAVLVFGFPLAPLVLDLCLVLEPLGVLARLPPNPVIDKLKIGLPTYRATRTLLEVTVESFPQALLLSYIFVRVVVFGAAAGAIDISMQLLVLSLIATCWCPAKIPGQRC